MTAHPSSAQAAQLANRRGIACMCGAMACFIVNDTAVKLVGQSMPAMQLIFLRGLFATTLLFGAAAWSGSLRQAGYLYDGRMLMRGLLDAGGNLAYLSSLIHIPLANATAINMAAPLFLILLAALVLREPLPWARRLAAGAGFAGVLLVVQPRWGGLPVFALLCVLGTALHALRDLMTRLIDPAVPSLLITLSSVSMVTLWALVASFWQGWSPATPLQLGELAGASVLLSLGYFLLIQAMRGGEIGLIAPFRYTGLLWAVLLGMAIWDQRPNALACGGIALLVAAGLYVLHSERRRMKRRAVLDAATD